MTLRGIAGCGIAALVSVLVGCGDRGSDERDAVAPRAWLVTHTSDGRVLLRSDDRGRTWSTIKAEAVGSIYFLDRERGWMTGHPPLGTIDGGSSWQAQAVDAGLDEPPRSEVVFGSAALGVTVGSVERPPFREGELIESADGGAHWRVAPRAVGSDGVGRSPATSFTDVCVTSTGVAVAVGEGGFDHVSSHSFALRRPAADAPWESALDGMIAAGASFGIGSVADVACVGADEVWLVGRRICDPFCDGESEPLVILHSEDGGVSWENASARTPVGSVDAGLVAVAFADARRGWVVGFEGVRFEDPRMIVLATIDGGRIWRRQTLPDEPTGVLAAVAFASSSDGLAIGTAEPGRPLLFVTDDGGQRWTAGALPAEVTSAGDVAYVR